jgi:hypothetical protein
VFNVVVDPKAIKAAANEEPPLYETTDVVKPPQDREDPNSTAEKPSEPLWQEGQVVVEEDAEEEARAAATQQQQVVVVDPKAIEAAANEEPPLYKPTDVVKPPQDREDPNSTAEKPSEPLWQEGQVVVEEDAEEEARAAATQQRQVTHPTPRRSPPKAKDMTPQTPRTAKAPKKKTPRKKRNPISSAKKRSKVQRLDLQQAALQGSFEAVIDHVNGLSKTGERWPFLAAAAAKKHRKKTVEEVFGINITHDEWHKIKVHAIYPGPFVEAPQKRFSRSKVKKDVLVKMLQYLDLPGNLQKYAVGRKIVALFHQTSYAELDNVARMKKLTRLAAEFISSLSAELDNISLSHQTNPEAVTALPESDKRCQHFEDATLRRCMCERGHGGKHTFTPPGSISLTTAMELIQSMTFSEIKRLTGLDDVKVSKGRENFEQMRQLAKIYCPAEQYPSMAKRIDDHELFCQTDLTLHFKSVGGHRCNCLTCGFFSEGKSRMGAGILVSLEFWQWSSGSAAV